MSEHPAFVEFEPAPLRRVLEALARALEADVEALLPGTRLRRREDVARELAALGIVADLDRLPTVRALVGAVVPLLETRPRAHH